jgi:hypothetical protein
VGGTNGYEFYVSKEELGISDIVCRVFKALAVFDNMIHYLVSLFIAAPWIICALDSIEDPCSPNFSVLIDQNNTLPPFLVKPANTVSPFLLPVLSCNSVDYSLTRREKLGVPCQLHDVIGINQWRWWCCRGCRGCYGVLGPPAGGLLGQENLEVLSGRRSLREDIRILI